MNLDELKKRFPNASQGFLRANSSVGAIPGRELEQRPSALEPLPKANKRSKRSPAYCVTFCAVRSRELDDDNLVGGLKPLRDSIAAHLGLADDKKSIRFRYSQVVSPGEQGTIVMIEPLTQK